MSVSVEKPSTTSQVAGLLMTGVAVNFLLGPLAALSAVVASVVLPKLARREARPPVPLEKRTISELAKPWKDFGMQAVKAQLLIGALLKMSGGLINQAGIHWIRQNLSTPIKTLHCYFRVSVVAPVIEEFFFRGFLQDRICDLQTLAFGAKAAASQIQTIIRVVLQAIAFGLAHYHPMQGAFNIFIVCSTAIVGLMYGMMKEETGAITQSISLHSLVNTSVTTRIWMFGA